MLLFAYGSNLAEEQVPGAECLGTALLRGHRLELNRRSIRWRGGVVDVVPAEGERVWGVLYEVGEPGLAARERGLPDDWLAVLGSVLRGLDRCAAGRAGCFRNG